MSGRPLQAGKWVSLPATISLGRTSLRGRVPALANEMPVLAGGPGHRGGQPGPSPAWPLAVLTSRHMSAICSPEAPLSQEPGQGLGRMGEPAIISAWRRTAGADRLRAQGSATIWRPSASAGAGSRLSPRGPDPEHLQAPQTPNLHLLEWWESGVLHHRAGGDAKGIGGAEQVGGNGRAPRLLLGKWGLHDEAFSTAAAAPRAGVLGAREQWVRVGVGRVREGPLQGPAGLPADSQVVAVLEMSFP